MKHLNNAHIVDTAKTASTIFLENTVVQHKPYDYISMHEHDESGNPKILKGLLQVKKIDDKRQKIDDIKESMCVQTFNIEVLQKIANKKARRARYKTNLQLQKQKQCGFIYQKGSYFNATLLTDLAPYNTKYGTEYLFKRGLSGVIIRGESSWHFYDVKGRRFNSLHDLKKFHSIKVARNEFLISQNSKVEFTRISKIENNGKPVNILVTSNEKGKGIMCKKL